MSPATDDTTLLARYLDHDDLEALGELVEKYRVPLYSFLLRSVPSPADAADAYQETWHRAIRSLQPRHAAHFSAWLFRIARNLLVDNSRRAHPAFSLDAPPHPSDSASSAPVDRLPDPAPSPDRRAADADTYARILAAANTLPALQREVFWLRMAAARSFKEIAAIQKTTVNTVASRMNYALEKMRALLNDLRP